MLNCFYDCYNILNKVYSEKAFIKQAISSTVIEEKNRSLTVKICYGVLDKDIELSYYISRLASKTPKLVIRTILKIAMYAIRYLNKKPYAVADNCVSLIKKLGKGGMSGFVNAFLRRFSSEEISLPGDNVLSMSVKYSYPQFALERLIKRYGENRAEKIISASYPDNTLVFYEIDGEEYLKDKNIQFYKTEFENVFTVKNFVRNDDYNKGIYTYQALGSVAICDVVEPCENLLDCCAAPGGKSVRLSFKCKSITACDIHEHRVELINDYLYRMHRQNVSTMICDSKEYNSEFDSKFDAVLCDVPCSGLGVINDNPDIKLNKTIENIHNLIKEQTSIINNISRYVKIGGALYYSTCSILDEENIDVVKQFLLENPNFVIEEITSKLKHEKIDGTLQFLPDISGGNGFYVAKLKRVK